MKIAFAAVDYDPEVHEPIAPFFYGVSVSVPITGRVFCDLDGRRTFKLRSKKIAEALAKAILDQEERDLKDGDEEEGEITIDPRSSWGDIEIDLGTGNYLYLTFPKGYEAVRKAFKKLPKSKLTREWGIEDGDQEDE